MVSKAVVPNKSLMSQKGVPVVAKRKPSERHGTALCSTTAWHRSGLMGVALPAACNLLSTSGFGPTCGP